MQLPWKLILTPPVPPAVTSAAGPAVVDVRRYAVIAAAMLTLCAVIGASTVWLLPVPTGTRLLASTLFTATAALIAASLLLPWTQLPHQLLVLYPVLGLGSLAVVGAATTGVGQVYVGFVVPSFILLGFAGSLRGVLALLPAAAVTWLLLNGLPDVPLSAALCVRLGIALSVWAAIGVVLARRSRDEHHRRTELVGDAHTDPLTGLANRRVLPAVLAAVRAGDVVVAVDLDEFRDINTTRGHGGGDTVLAEFGRTVRMGLRAGDHAIRQGGDEFILVLTAVSDVQVLTVLNRLRDRWQQACGSVTFSAGAATVRAGQTGPDTLRRADLHCYQAKNAGRDQWTLDPTDTDTAVGPGPVAAQKVDSAAARNG